MGAEVVDRFAPVGAFRHQAHVRLASDERSDPSAQQRMIVHRQDSNWIRRGAHAFVPVLLDDHQKRRPDEVAYALEAGIVSLTSVPDPS